MQNDNVKVSVFVVTSKGAELVGSTVHGVDPGCLTPQRGDICDGIVSKIVEKKDDEMYSETPAWSAAFLQGMCHARKVVNRVSPEEDMIHVDQSPTKQACRMLSIVTNFEESSKRYLPCMNGFFAAQRDSIMIDCCNLEHGEETSSSCESLFQQGCQMTGGFYMRPKVPESLLEYLMTAFMADSSVRGFLRYPSACGVDYRASCFCHKKLVDTGYVCSVCLSVFCEKMNVCLTCGSEFNEL